MRSRLAVLAVALLLGSLSACGAAATDPPPLPDLCPASPASAAVVSDVSGLRQTVVLPRSTASCQLIATDSHYVYIAPAATLRGRLFVFLPGTGGIPRNYRLIVQDAAAQGFHAVGLAYPNADAIGTLCAGRGPSCHGPARQEVVSGQDLSSLVQVGPFDAIEGRLLALLSFMQAADPTRNWARFIVNGGVDWANVSVAGHSQGGGHALFLAQRRSVFRASAFASGGDLVDGGDVPASWVSQPFLTPAANIFGFISTRDELVSTAGTVTAWQQIGLGAFGSVTSVDGATAPFGGAHMLTTARDPAFPGLVIGPNHNVVAVDINTPRDAGGALVFAPVWRYMALGL